MRQIILVVMIFTSCLAVGQTVDLNISKSDGNNIEIAQVGDSANAKADITESDGNRVRVNQLDTLSKDKEVKPNQSKNFDDFIKSTSGVVTLLIAMATLIGIIWKSVYKFKRRKLQ